MTTDTDVVPSELVLLVQRREKAQTETEFNAVTVLVIEALGRARFPRLEVQQAAWVRVIEKLLRALADRSFPYPYKFDQEGGEDVLCVRTSHIMEYMRECRWLYDCWSDMPIRSDRVLKRHLAAAGVLLVDAQGIAKPFERTLNGQRMGHLAAIRLVVLRAAGLDPMGAFQAAPTGARP